MLTQFLEDGILGFMRAIAGHFKVLDGIRVNAICPGPVRSGLLPPVVWERLDPDLLVPPELVAKLVLLLGDGGEIVDTKGQTVSADKAYGQAIVINADKFYLTPEHEYSDEAVARSISWTKVEAQAGYGIEK